MREKIKPFVKWAGGKTQLLPILLENFQYECKIYIEAFIGGGALFLTILDNLEETQIEKIIINDINKKLITTYEVIRDNINNLIYELKNIENSYNSLETFEEKENLFYQIRDEFNLNNTDSLKIARDFIFLNKTCFNGLYRENSKGKFNVPFGKKEKASIFDEENLLLLSQKLNLEKNGKKIVEIRQGDFFSLEKEISSETFFYLDPPYRPITKNGFTDYNKSSFNDDTQKKLAEFCNKINQAGGKFLLSNSDSKVSDVNDNFFDDLYKNYCIERVEARRNINSKGNGRGKINEILVKNYRLKRDDELKLFLGGEMSKDFNLFLSQLKETNATLDYFVDFEKVRNNINKVSLKLNTLNYLLGKENLQEAIRDIYLENKSAFKVLNILIAVRDSKVKTIYDGNFYSLEDFFDTPENIYKFVKLTKLEEVFKNREIKNLVDYVYGIEVGLDTNARKNRGGSNMSKIVENLFLENNISYRKEVKSTEFSELASLGKDIKQFDFVIYTDKTYLIEVNFYSSGGSKLNEVARAYTDIAPKINQNKNFEFVWITDGIGWHTAKNKLEEAYINIPSVYNLTTLQEFITKLKN